ncbi:MAG: glutathione peroxidase, partial [Flavobacteriales bacterium]
AMKSFYDLQAIANNGQPFHMSSLKGRKVMLVNTASLCGFTPQYVQLQELYEAYKKQGLEILAFPSNDFGQQEPDSDNDIAKFCTVNYGITFPLMQKVRVTGDNTCEVYSWIASKNLNGKTDIRITWNFQKILVDENGLLVKSISPAADPFHADILAWLTQSTLF